ncbi:MAG: nitrilase-related carbon-nitrogen hydrolase, partial [Desulfohalobiaceae bacterium]
LFKDSGKARYRKQRLVPIGESRPPWIVAPFVGPVGETGNHVLPGRIRSPLEWQGTQFGPLVCWEIRFPGVVTDHLLAGTDILVNPANESWLDSDIAKQRSLAVARMRAAETGRMLLRIANWGLSAVIGPRGEILARLSGREPFAEVMQIKTYEGNTPYMALGLENRLRALSFLLLFIGPVTLGFVRKLSLCRRSSGARMNNK